jgi:SAM-dependent methyltransferase
MSEAGEPSTSRSWEDEADNWTAWARTPGHDVFDSYAPAFFEEVLPPARGLTLEIGCGEGRVARALVERGYDVAALDASPRLVRNARAEDARSTYVLADATALPFADEGFELVVAYNSLQTMAEESDMARAVAEAGRVLKADGHFCLCVAHPMTDIGFLRRTASEDDLVVAGSYFERRRVNETVTKDSLEMTFHGWTYTLEDYARALESTGFVIERVREPVPSGTTQPTLWQRVPLFLMIRAVKR